MSANVVFTSAMPTTFEDTYVTAIPMDAVIGQQLSRQLDATQNFIRSTVQMLLHHEFLESLHNESLLNLSIILLLVERLRSSSILGEFVQKTLCESQIHFATLWKECEFSEDDQILISFLAISFAFLVTRLCYARRPFSWYLLIAMIFFVYFAMILLVCFFVSLSPIIIRECVAIAGIA
jgi:hypothetical protein